MNVRVVSSLCRITAAALVWESFAGDQPQWGERFSRNIVSSERGLPAGFDLATGKNVRWIADLGTDTYATPVVAGGQIYIGTNNGKPRDERVLGDRGVLMCFRECDGHFLWQLTVPKIKTSPYWDWPNVGLCSPATVEGDRIYLVSNRGEVMCLDAKGMSDGNGGPFTDEGRHMVPAGQAALVPGQKDADILWIYDMIRECGIRQHDSAHASVLVDGPFLYVNTSNGVDDTHRHIVSPDAPCLIVLDKATGRLVARDGEHIGPSIFHCSWSSPALGFAGACKLIVYAAPNGIVYAFEPVTEVKEAVQTLKKVWWFDIDPTAPKEDVHRFIGNRTESPSTIHSLPVFTGGRVYVAGGGDIWWGKRQAWLVCLDATGTGDVTATARRWAYPLMRHDLASPSVFGGLVFIGDIGRRFHCVDAATGQACWTHDVQSEIWSSALVADGKVYVGTRRGEFLVFSAQREKRLLFSAVLDGPISGSPVAANGVLYVATKERLYAFAVPPGNK